MSLLRFIVIAGILMYNSQKHTIFGVNGDGYTWFSFGPNEAFSHFIEHKNRVLDVEKISTFLVGFVTECALRCLRVVSCVSFNIKNATENSKEMTCELLPKDLYNASLKFRKSKNSHHWSIIVSKPFSLIFSFILHLTLHITRFEH